MRILWAGLYPTELAASGPHMPSGAISRVDVSAMWRPGDVAAHVIWSALQEARDPEWLEIETTLVLPDGMRAVGMGYETLGHGVTVGSTGLEAFIFSRDGDYSVELVAAGGRDGLADASQLPLASLPLRVSGVRQRYEAEIRLNEESTQRNREMAERHREEAAQEEAQRAWRYRVEVERLGSRSGEPGHLPQLSGRVCIHGLPVSVCRYCRK